MEQPNAVFVEWEQSPQYKNWLASFKGVKDILESKAEAIKDLQLAQSYGVYAKGGSIEEKVVMEEVKQENKKELLKEKQFFASILKDNELMLKSLIKVFK